MSNEQTQEPTQEPEAQCIAQALADLVSARRFLREFSTAKWIDSQESTYEDGKKLLEQSLNHSAHAFHCIADLCRWHKVPLDVMPLKEEK
jgi:hypothetical protein